MLDVNAGVTSVNPNETEPALLVKTREIVQGLVDHGLHLALALEQVAVGVEADLQLTVGMAFLVLG